jgi:hypothetical protein
MDRSAFFAKVRRTLFGGRLTAAQVEGVSKILDYRESHWPKMIDEELAYILATALLETGSKMQPIPEGGGQKYLKSKPYYPWYGRGLVQITWRRNYLKWGITNPDDALTWDNALRIIFEGMIYGSFTGYKLADFIAADGQNYVGARAIVNGRDKAKEIADYAEAFLEAFQSARDPIAAAEETDRSYKENPMTPALASILNMIVGNPLTGIPGAFGFCLTLGPVLHALADLLIEVGQGQNLWAALGKFASNPACAGFGASIIGLTSKDHNVTGGTKQQ